MNYIKRGEASGTWLESHFRWQIRTFWFGVIWAALCGLFVLLTVCVGLLIVWLPLGILTLWFIYRVARGWMALRDRRPMYAPVAGIYASTGLEQRDASSGWLS